VPNIEYGLNFLFKHLKYYSVFVFPIVGENDVEYSLAAQPVLFREQDTVANENIGPVG
jgi:hypothetical protein